MAILTLLIFIPIIGAIILFFIPRNNISLIKLLGLGFTFIVFLLSLKMTLDFNPAIAGFQFQKQIPWIPQLNIYYHLGVDGISVPMIFLTGLLTFLAGIASWNINTRVKEYWVFYLLLESTMMGTFIALDLFLFYIFWVLMLVPIYFLIGIWGGKKNMPAIKFFLYSFAGSLLTLIGLLALYFTAEAYTFNIPKLHEGRFNIFYLAMNSFRYMGISLPHLVFLAIFIGFAIRIPVWPFHTWLPDLHSEAPTPISVIMSAISLKIGVYGFYRIVLPILPDAARDFSWLFLWLGIIGIVYGAFVAMAQTDFKKLLAYSNLSNMGFILLGISAFNMEGFIGAYYQMFSHGILSGALFLLLGVLYERTQTTDLTAYGGLAAKLPIYTFVLSIMALGLLGLPILSGFVAKFFIFIGVFAVYKEFAIIAIFSLLITASYILYTLQRILFGPLNKKWADLQDMNNTELLTLLPLLIISIALGVYPLLLLNLINPVLNRLLFAILGTVS